MWQRFTERARRVVFFAQEEAGRLGQHNVDTEHLLLGLVRENDSVAARILEKMGVSLGRVRSNIERNVTRSDGRLGQDMQLTPAGKRAIEYAYDESRTLKNKYIGTEHLLLGLIREGEGLGARVLAKLGVDLEATRQKVREAQDKFDTDPRASLHLFSLREVMKTLPMEQQALLAGDGIAFDELPEEAREAIENALEYETKQSALSVSLADARVQWVKSEQEGGADYELTVATTVRLRLQQTPPA